MVSDWFILVRLELGKALLGNKQLEKRLELEREPKILNNQRGVEIVYRIQGLRGR